MNSCHTRRTHRVPYSMDLSSRASFPTSCASCPSYANSPCGPSRHQRTLPARVLGRCRRATRTSSPVTVPITLAPGSHARPVSHLSHCLWSCRMEAETFCQLFVSLPCYVITGKFLFFCEKFIYGYLPPRCSPTLCECVCHTPLSPLTHLSLSLSHTQTCTVSHMHTPSQTRGSLFLTYHCSAHKFVNPTPEFIWCCSYV